jgi:F420-dependent oxidoreductase-like protein
VLRLADPTLVVLVGPSASGKTTWALEHFAADQVVSSDRLRAVVGEGEQDIEASKDAFALLETVVATRVGRRLTTVVDTLGMDAERRAGWLRLAAARRVPAVAVAFDTPAAECRRRNAERPHPVPRAVLDRQLREFRAQRALLAAEGFAEVLAPEPVRVVIPEVAAAARAGLPADTASPAVAAPGAAGPGAAGPGAAGAGDDGPGDLRFGLHLSAWDVPGGPAALGPRLAEVAAAAEAAGFSSIWVMDHLRQIPQVGRAWEDMPESTATLGYLAAATRTIELGCLVNCVTYRNVAHLAKIVATLDVLSGGRAWCGVGAGWFEAEHTGYGWPFPPAAERLDLLEDALQLLPVMWGPGSKPFHGRRIDVPETLCYPRPLRDRVPILVGGSGERRTLRLVARYADACNLMGDAAAVAAKLEVLRRHCADVGRDPAEVEVTHLSTALVARTPAELAADVDRRRPRHGAARWVRRVNPGTVEDHVLRVRALRAAGVRHVIVSLAGVWDSPAVETFAGVIAATREAARA